MYKAEEIYDGFHYPKAYLNLMDDWECRYFGEWDYLPEESVEGKINDLKRLYPERKLIPFAEKKRKDSIACFECEKGNKVVVVHPLLSPGQEVSEELDDVWEWLHFAVDGMKADCESFDRCDSCPFYEESKANEELLFYKTGGQYKGLQCPAAYFCLLERRLYDYGVWNLIPKSRLQEEKISLVKRYHRMLVPFAERWDCDDRACFETFKESKVMIVHDWASCGWEQHEILDDFWAWMHFAVEETKFESNDHD